jgi:hypothetical protein
MYRILSASHDTYITDKIINNSFRAKDANVGQAGTLDLFKIHNETTLTGSKEQFEISRALIKFDLTPVTDMQNDGTIDINSSNFKAILQLHDIYGGQTTPSNFHLIVFPLSQSFDEGSGYDVSQFEDIDATNFITASVTAGTATLWNRQGALASGSLGDTGIDVIVSGALEGPSGTNTVAIAQLQYFEEGTEDLYVDMTTFVSGVFSSQITNHGLLIAYSGSYEQNDKTYYVKRFASRNVANTAIRPKLILKYDDSIHDNHQDFIFDVTSSLYLNNFHYDSAANILSGAAATALTGNECMQLKIESGSFKKTYNVSQAKRGVKTLTGMYSASFAISSFESTLRDDLLYSGSITFREIWGSTDGTVSFLSSSLTINNNSRNAYENKHQSLLVSLLNLRESYDSDDVVKIRVFSEDRNRDVVFNKLPLEKKSQIYHEMYYRVRDFQTDDIIIPFDTVSKSTRLSTDSSGMYFEFYVSSLPRGRTYVFDFLIKKNGFDTIITDAASKFRVN